MAPENREPLTPSRIEEDRHDEHFGTRSNCEETIGALEIETRAAISMMKTKRAGRNMIE